MRMEFGAELDGSQDFFQMFWPTILAHKIDEDSPLWDISPRLDAYSMCPSPLFIQTCELKTRE